MITSSDWDFNKLDHGTHKIAGEVQLRGYGRFLEEYSTQLQGIKEALEDYMGNAWDMSVDPISVGFAPYEKCALQQLIDTDNKVLNKVLMVFTTLCVEVRSLQKEAETNFYETLLFYGEGNDVPEAQDGVAPLMMGSLLPYLQELSCFIKRCEEVSIQIVQQLAAVYSGSHESSQVMNALHVHFQDVFDHLGDLLLILITLDEILGNHSTLKEHWVIYKRTIASIHREPKFDVKHDKLSTFEKILTELEQQLLTGKIFQQIIEKSFDNKYVQVSKSSALLDEFSFYLKTSLSDLELKANEKVYGTHPLIWVKLSALFVLNFHIFGSVDKKLFKQLWDVHKRIPIVPLIGNVSWLPEHFLLNHLSAAAKAIDRKSPQNVNSSRLNFLQHLNLPREANIFCLQTFSWMIHMENSLKQESSQLKLDDLIERCQLFLQGVEIACTISHLLKVIMNLHVFLSKPMTKTEVIALCKMIELLKGIQHMYHRHNIAVSESVNHVIQHVSYKALNIIASAKKGLVQDKRYSEKHLDILSSLVLAEKTLHGSVTKERQLVLHLALSCANQMRTFRDDELVQLSSLLHKLKIISDIQEKITYSCDCSFLYWHRVLLPIYFSHVYENKGDINNIIYMFCALKDCILAMERIGQDSMKNALKKSFDKEILKYIQDQVIQPLCHDTETNLRLHVHSHLQLEDRNPFRVGIEDNSPLLHIRPLRLYNKLIHIKGFVEHYLQETFYNLTTVALHDWKTYGEMRTLASHKFGLETVEDHLPSQTLEQGLDVLEIMRNIHIFVSKYLYNLNNQIFIEQSSNNKHLNTINIRHVANSIRTHGTGIMNTTVNFTYQFLRKKFFIFSQFMYDEHIKSRLIKDLRFFRENKVQLEQKYSYDRADKFNKGIRKLGITVDGQSFLDQFRMLISNIGNAMGYVRMIRSGGLHCCSNAICFISDLEDIISFEDLCVEEGLSGSCQTAAQKLDQVISNLTRNFAEGTEYFKLLVDVFAPEFHDPKNKHLRNFYMIVPPLTINFVEHSINCKEKLSKKKKNDAAFTDDGFAMGIAYILKLLDQYAEFDSLHWFQSVRDKYNKDKVSLAKQKAVASRDDEKLQQTMTLTARRLDIYLQEFDLLYFSLSSARIFFQKDKTVVETNVNGDNL